MGPKNKIKKSFRAPIRKKSIEQNAKMEKNAKLMQLKKHKNTELKRKTISSSGNVVQDVPLLGTSPEILTQNEPQPNDEARLCNDDSANTCVSLEENLNNNSEKNKNSEKSSVLSDGSKLFSSTVSSDSEEDDIGKRLKSVLEGISSPKTTKDCSETTLDTVQDKNNNDNESAAMEIADNDLKIEKSVDTDNLVTESAKVLSEKNNTVTNKLRNESDVNKGLSEGVKESETGTNTSGPNEIPNSVNSNAQVLDTEPNKKCADATECIENTQVSVDTGCTTNDPEDMVTEDDNETGLKNEHMKKKKEKLIKATSGGKVVSKTKSFKAKNLGDTKVKKTILKFGPAVDPQAKNAGEIKEKLWRISNFRKEQKSKIESPKKDGKAKVKFDQSKTHKAAEKKTVKKKQSQDLCLKSSQYPLCVCSQPSKTLSHYERLLWLQQRRGAGLWVRCDRRLAGSALCNKWRYLPDNADPTELPDKWYCSMHPDPALASCSAEEHPPTLQEQEDLVHNLYTAGSVVWGRAEGYPWWPAMVDDCVDTEQYYWLNSYSDIPTHYNVVFFDLLEPTRCWLLPENIQPMDSATPPNGRITRNKLYGKRIQHAVEQAMNAKKLPIKQRLKKYSFLSVYRGEILTPPAPASLASQTPELFTLQEQNAKSTAQSSEQSKLDEISESLQTLICTLNAEP